MIFYTCTHKLKSVLDNSGSRQGQEATNSTCHEVMTVHKNEQVFTNKQWLFVSSLAGGISSHFPQSFFFLPPFFLLSFPPPPFCLLPSQPPNFFSSFLHFLNRNMIIIFINIVIIKICEITQQLLLLLL